MCSQVLLRCPEALVLYGNEIIKRKEELCVVLTSELEEALSYTCTSN